jgi:hypothetical protein
MTGPVQVLVVGFDEASFSGEVIAELTRLREAGIVRLLDLLLVSRDDDGSLMVLPPPPGADPGLGRLTAAVLGADDEEDEPTLAGDGDGDGDGDGGSGDDGGGDAWSLDDAVPDHGSVAVALIEHTWAQPLVTAIRRGGGRPVDETWLAPSDLERLERLDSVPAD